MFDFLRYLRLKLLASIVRLLVRLTAGPTLSAPDQVVRIASRSAGRDIMLHVDQSKTGRARPGPVLLNLHGSGSIIPMHGSDDEFCARVARETDYTVLDMQYRLAPENPFPAALDDVEDAMEWILKQSDQFDVSRLAISGFSASGNLALAAAGVVFPKDTFTSIIAFYPSTNKAVDPAERKVPDASARVVSPAMSRIFDECYIPRSIDRKDPRISPLFAPTEAFPSKVLFITAAQDNLCLEGEALAQRIQDANGKRRVVVKRMEGCGHGWDKQKGLGLLQQAAKDEAYGLAIDMLRS